MVEAPAGLGVMDAGPMQFLSESLPSDISNGHIKSPSPRLIQRKFAAHLQVPGMSPAQKPHLCKGCLPEDRPDSSFPDNDRSG